MESVSRAYVEHQVALTMLRIARNILQEVTQKRLLPARVKTDLGVVVGMLGHSELHLNESLSTLTVKRSINESP